MTVPKISTLVSLSGLLAVVGASPGIFHLKRNAQLMAFDNLRTNVLIWASFLAGLLWMLLAFVAIRTYGKRGLWALVGIPSVYLPLCIAIVLVSCWTGNACI